MVSQSDTRRYFVLETPELYEMDGEDSLWPKPLTSTATVVVNSDMPGKRAWCWALFGVRLHMRGCGWAFAICATGFGGECKQQCLSLSTIYEWKVRSACGKEINMQRVIIICSVLVLVLTVSALAQGYAKGYEDGKQAAREDVRSSDLISLTTGKFAVVPAERIKQIENMPEVYQRGFLKGYREGVQQAIVLAPKFWLGFVLWMAIALAVLVPLIMLA